MSSWHERIEAELKAQRDKATKEIENQAKAKEEKFAKVQAEFEQALAVYTKLRVKDRFVEIMGYIWKKGAMEEWIYPPSRDSGYWHVGNRLFFERRFIFPYTYRMDEGDYYGENDPRNHSAYRNIQATSRAKFSTSLGVEVGAGGKYLWVSNGAVLDEGDRKKDGGNINVYGNGIDLLSGKRISGMDARQTSVTAFTLPTVSESIEPNLTQALASCLAQKTKDLHLPTNYTQLLDKRYPGWVAK